MTTDVEALVQEAREFAAAHRSLGEPFTEDRYTRLADALESLNRENQALAHVTQTLNGQVDRVRAYANGYDDHVRVELLEILDGTP